MQFHIVKDGGWGVARGMGGHPDGLLIIRGNILMLAEEFKLKFGK